GSSGLPKSIFISSRQPLAARFDECRYRPHLHGPVAHHQQQEFRNPNPDPASKLQHILTVESNSKFECQAYLD
ncbi:hypothetical protein ACLOJK_004223, partial [Asimina triloba]